MPQPSGQTVTDKRFPGTGRGVVLNVNRDGTLLVQWLRDRFVERIKSKHLRFTG